MIFDTLDNWQRYFHNEAWKQSFDFIRSLQPGAPEGFTELRGHDLYARVMSYETVEESEGAPEAHREYIDIQAALVNEERIAWFPLGAAAMTDSYDAEKDVTHYRRPSVSYGSVIVRPGTFVVFFPEDGHTPKLLSDAPRVMKKVVIKIRVSLGSETN
jgi:YhcH/YjgK/YiaL family protein